MINIRRDAYVLYIVKDINFVDDKYYIIYWQYYLSHFILIQYYSLQIIRLKEKINK